MNIKTILIGRVDVESVSSSSNNCIIYGYRA